MFFYSIHFSFKPYYFKAFLICIFSSKNFLRYKIVALKKKNFKLLTNDIYEF